MQKSKFPKLNINYDSNIWFSPKKIIKRYDYWYSFLGDKLKHGDYKSIAEARSVALLLLGIMKLSNKMFWLQIVEPIEQTPDIRTMNLIKDNKFNRVIYQDIEVVTFNKYYKKDDIVEFLLNKKLDDKRKFYPKDTIILCHADLHITLDPWQEVHQNLVNARLKNDTYLLARIDPQLQLYRLAKVHPKIENIVDFDVDEELKTMKSLSLRLIKGKPTKYLYQNNTDKIEPF